jgi:hypothetical protein
MPANINNIYLHPTIVNNAGVSGQALTVSSAVVTLAATTAFNTLTQFVTVDVQTNDVYCTFGGDTPSTSNGHRLYAGQNYTWSKQAALSAKFIRASADAVLYASEWTL